MDAFKNPKWYDDLLSAIRDERDDLQKAHLMRQLTFDLIRESRKQSANGGSTQTNPVLSKETFLKHFEEYINFVDSSEAVLAEQQPEDIAVDASKWKCTLTDPQKFLKYMNANGTKGETDPIVNTEPKNLVTNNSFDGASNSDSVDQVEKRDHKTAIENESWPEWNIPMELEQENYVVDGSGPSVPKTMPEMPSSQAIGSKFTFHKPSNSSSSHKSSFQNPLNTNTSTLPNFHKPHDNNHFDSFQNVQSKGVRPVSSTYAPANHNSNKRKLQDGSVDGEPPNRYSNPIEMPRISGISSLLRPLPQQPLRQQQNIPTAQPAFRTGLEELEIRYDKKYGNYSASNANAAHGHGHQEYPGQQPPQNQQHPLMAYGTQKRKLGFNGFNSRSNGGDRRTVVSKFVPPFAADYASSTRQTESPSSVSSASAATAATGGEDERLRHIDPKMIELIRSEIMERHTSVDWDDIAGLEYAKTTIKEAVVWPILRPDIFTGLRRPPRGILLFGPPGTGKTMVGKCIASQSNSTFFSISASSLTSKWVGDGEKMVRALFAVAATYQPAVVFIDEIDSLLCQRSESEHESSRRLKTEFLVQLDGASTAENERILIVGATNRPQELDEAARRRLVKRLYIPLPEMEARVQILSNLLKKERTDITMAEIKRVGELSVGFSGADMQTLCHEASMGPIRSISETQMNFVGVDDVRPVNYSDFKSALECVRASVSPNDLKHYIDWDRTYGSGAGKK